MKLAPRQSSSLPARRFRSLAAPLLVLTLAALASPPASGQSLPPGVLKLHSRGTTSKNFNNFGSATAVSDTWMVVGEPFNKDRASDGGAAYVYLATTGRFVRSLVPSDPSINAEFGTSVAINGPLALVGAPGQDGPGAAYVFDLASGRQLAKLSPPDGAADDQFGASVAIRGNLALVGAWGHNSNRGAAYLFHARTGGAPLGKLVTANAAATPQFGSSVALDGRFALVGAEFADPDPANVDGVEGAAFLYDVSTAFHTAPTFPLLATLSASDGVHGDFFGDSVALSGHRALVGAPLKTGLRGGAYLFEAATGGQIHAFTASDAAPGDIFGKSVALNGSLAVIGAPSNSAAYVFDGASGSQFLHLTAPDSNSNIFGGAVSVAGNRVLVGATSDPDLAALAGAAYLFRPVSIPLPLSPIAKVGDFAPGAVEANFAGFFSAYLGSAGHVGLSSLLSQRGRGVWNTYSGQFNSSVQTTTDLTGAGLPGLTPAAFGEVIPEDDDYLYLQTFLRGAGVGKTNNLAWLRHSGMAGPFKVLRHGDAFAELAGSPTFASFPEVVSKAGEGHIAFAYTLARSAVTGVTLANDSGVSIRDHNGVTLRPLDNGINHREGEVSPTGNVADRYGQFFGRVCVTPDDGYFTFPAYYFVASKVTVSHGVFYATDDGDGHNPVALVGGTANMGSAPTYRAFLGEVQTDAFASFRALLTGGNVTSATDEGLFREGSNKPYFVEGDAVDATNLPGVTIGRFLGYWGHSGSDALIALVTLRGPGVNARNDLAVLHRRVDNAPLILLREGDTVGADDAAQVAVIQRVDVDSVTGRYHILAGLTGAPSRNQALFVGHAEAGDEATLKGRKLPGMALRKGQGYQQRGGETSAIKTILMPVSTDRTGAGCRGHGQAINQFGDLVITLEFTNRAREVWRGQP